MTERATPSLLARAHRPWLLEFVGGRGDGYEFAWAAEGRGVATRVLRGWKMTRLLGLYDEIGAALQFPNYFAENRASLDECLTDLSWIPAAAYALVILDATTVLSDEDDDVFDMLIDVLVTAATVWDTPVDQGETWDRPAIPFHVLLQVEPNERECLQQRLVAARGEMGVWETWSETE